MKTKLFYGMLIFSILLLGACNKWVDTGLNIDPTSPADASLNVILPTAQAGTAYVLGGDVGRFTALLTQHITGTDRQHLGLYNYTITESDIDNAWTTMYSGPMMDMYGMINKARANGSPVYQGIAEVLMAYSIGMWTDILGDIPYSAAFQGNANLTPKYDSQEQIYNSINQLLDSAIIHLAITKNNFKPGGDDFIYGGSAAEWTKAAYTLKARFYLHVKKLSEALTALGQGFTSNDDDMQFIFGNSETTANPWYQFITQRGDISSGSYLIPLMNTLKDPRRSAYAVPDSNGNYAPSDAIGAYYTSINSPVPFITFAEAKFIEAECSFRNGNNAGAYSAYTDAIMASMSRFGVDSASAATYFAQAAVGVGEANLTLENIMVQKYIAMFTQYESWADWRRTGFPQLTPTKGTQIPRRFPYPQSERLFNGKNLQAVPGYSAGTTFMFTKVWWDATYWP